VARRDSKNHDSPLQVEAICGPPDHNQSKEHETRRIDSDAIKTASRRHPDRRFDKDRRRRGQSYDPAGLGQNRPGP